MGMINQEPVSELHAQFSSEGATPTTWAEAREHLEKAEIFRGSYFSGEIVWQTKVSMRM